MPVVHEVCCGLDVHKKSVTACVLWASGRRRQTRAFGTFTRELRGKESQAIHRPELAEWPHYIGTDQVRNYRLDGVRPILSLEEIIPNVGRRRSQITWERVTE